VNKVLILSIFISFSSYARTINVKFQERRPEIYEKSNSPFGPIYDIVNELLRTSNLEGNYSWMPWSRALSNAKGKEAMLLVRHSMPEERRSFLLPIPYGFEVRQVHFFKNKNSKVSVKKYEDLYKYSIGYRNKSFYSPRFKDDKNLNKVPLKRDEQLLNLLKRKRVDLVIFNSKIQFLEMSKELNIKFEDNFEKVEFIETFPNGRYFSIPKGSDYEKYYHTLNCSMYKLRKSGKVSHFFEKHGLKKLSQTFVDTDSIRQKESCKKSVSTKDAQ
jgi:polar amino acid transport system substrate-binding protein